MARRTHRRRPHLGGRRHRRRSDRRRRGAARSLLLGASRVDLSALVVAVAVAHNLADNGRGGFLLPAALFFSDAAHAAFRRSPSLRLDELFAFTESAVFPAGTKYCAALL